MKSELSGRQSAVLEALRAKADNGNLVEIRAAVLAEAANIPLGFASLGSSVARKEATHPDHASRISEGSTIYKVI